MWAQRPDTDSAVLHSLQTKHSFAPPRAATENICEVVVVCVCVYVCMCLCACVCMCVCCSFVSGCKTPKQVPPYLSDTYIYNERVTRWLWKPRIPKKNSANFPKRLFYFSETQITCVCLSFGYVKGPFEITMVITSHYLNENVKIEMYFS